MKKTFTAVLCVLCTLAPKAWAEPFSESQFEALRIQVQQLTSVVQDLKQTVDSQRAEINILKSGREQRAIEPAVVSQPISGERTLQGRWNPDIGVVADVLFSHDSPKLDEEGADRVAVRELELVLGSAVDPYSRLDATLAISDFEGMELEEAYYTHFDLLGWGVTGRAGRFLPHIGKAIRVHRDSLDTVDEPRVVEKYFGHHGYNKTGADLTRSIDLPWEMTHQATFGVLEGGNGEEGALFGEVRRCPTLYANLKNYVDLNDSTGFEFGFSNLAGSRDEDTQFEVNVIGLDGTLSHRYGDQRHIKFQAEAFRVSREESFYWGSYLLADWRFHPQWAAGFRFDEVQLIETAEDFANPDPKELGYTGYLTFYQSEFARWRLQFTHADLTSGEDDNRVFVQGTFAIGEHKHKIT